MTLLIDWNLVKISDMKFIVAKIWQCRWAVLIITVIVSACLHLYLSRIAYILSHIIPVDHYFLSDCRHSKCLYFARIKSLDDITLTAKSKLAFVIRILLTLISRYLTNGHFWNLRASAIKLYDPWIKIYDLYLSLFILHRSLRLHIHLISMYIGDKI